MRMNDVQIEDKIREYIYQQYPDLQGKLAENDPLEGVLDSLAVLGVVGFIEPEFSIELSASDLTDENFESVASIARLIERLSSAVK